MNLICRICENSENNRMHRAREMMFGSHEPFDYLECGACGTLQIAEIPDLSRHYPKEYYSFASMDELWFTRKLKSRIAARLAGEYFVKGRNFGGKLLAEKKDWINFYYPQSLKEPLLNLNFDSRILDFGCGAGRLLHILRTFGFRNLTGADAFIEKDISYTNGVKVYKKRLDEINSKFDLIMLHHSFEHLTNPLETLRDLRPLLDKNGVCLIRLPLKNFAWEKYGINWVQLDAPRHIFLYTEKSFRALAEKVGFTVEKVVYDSESFQFWGSEQYLQNIPLTDERAYKGVISESVFTQKQIDDWQNEAENLNAKCKGDQACFYLKKS